MPTEVGIHATWAIESRLAWVPAFAGMMRVVLTLATLAAVVSSSITKSWKAVRSGATHFKRKSVSPDSM